MVERRERRRKTYYPRVNRVTRYDDQKFVERYRISKDVVLDLAMQFDASAMCTTSASTRGGGLSIEERVSRLLFWCPIVTEPKEMLM